jgi:putative DNA primase/helicase
MSAPPTVKVRDLTVAGVLFTDERSKVPVPHQGPILTLIGSRHQPRTDKRGCGAFSLVRYSPGVTRGKRNVVDVHGVVLDYDHLVADEANRLRELLRGRAYVLYTSFSHRAKGADDCCLRVILFPTRPMTPAEFERVWSGVNEELGRLADAHTRDASRIWYLPACPPERMANARFEVRDGELLDVEDMLSRSATAAPTQAPRAQRKRTREGGASTTGSIAPGRRNAELMRLAGAMRRQGAEEDAIRAALTSVNAERCIPPLSDDEVATIARSVTRYNPASPLIAANCTDAGNAERFVHFCGQDFLYTHIHGWWYSWDGRRFRRDNSGQSLRSALATIRASAAEAEANSDHEVRDRLVAWTLESESSARLNALLSIATSKLPVAVEDLDVPPLLLNCINGTVDLATGELRRHDRADRLTRLAPVAYDAGATCPRWDAFLARITGNNEELVRFLQRAVGYSLSASTKEQVLFLLYGTGANGKSTFLETVRALLGDYFTQADFSTFLNLQQDGPRNDIARLAGARMVAAVEAESGQGFAEATVKQVTGGDTISARFLYGEFFEFRPFFKLWLAANHRPTIRGGDLGIWRRIRLIPFTVTIPEAERDPNLLDALRLELPGILAWAVRGCGDWLRDGLGVPEEVRAATDHYRAEMDVLGEFFAARCLLEPGVELASKALYAGYLQWCEENGDKPVSQKALSRRLAELGLTPRKAAKGARVWTGIRLRGEADLVPDGGGWRVGGANSGNSNFGNTDRLRVDETHSPTRQLPDLAPQSATCHPSDPSDDPSWDEGEL